MYSSESYERVRDKNQKERTMKILVIHGPNLNLLGKREPEVYGKETLEEIDAKIMKKAGELGVEVECRQYDGEGEIVGEIGRAPETGFDWLIINPAGYTHTSVAIRDAVAAVKIPAIEVHLSNVYAREEFRKRSLIAPVAVGQISGFGSRSYLLALEAAAEKK